MKTIDLIQGAPEWHAHRASHFNASDAPAMMGCSAYKTRSQLLHEKHTGMAPEVDAATQRRFDEGHRIEALARPLAEDRIGEELYPVTGSEGKFSASFDGLTMMEDIAFEHKTLNAELLEALKGGNCQGWGLPMQYQVQMEHQLMVSGAEKCLFMASKWQGDTLLDVQHCWYVPNEALREQIIAGWAQFEIDLAAYVPTDVVQAAIAAPALGLPAVSIQVNGSIALIDNLSVFGDALKAYIANINTKPETDQDFANLDGAAKTMKKAEDALEAAEAGALAQTASIDAMRRTVAQYKEQARQTRLLCERLFKTEKDNRKVAIVQAGVKAFNDHIAALNIRLGKNYMPTVMCDFQTAVKGLKTLDSMKNAVDTELAHGKILANAMADKLQANMKEINGLIVGLETLFPDYMLLVLKENADMVAVVKNRISEHKASEEKRIEAEREKIRIEERAALEKEAADAANAALAAVPAIGKTVSLSREEVADLFLPAITPKPTTLKAVKAEPALNDNFNTLTALLWRLTDAENAQILEYVRANYAERLAA